MPKRPAVVDGRFTCAEGNALQLLEAHIRRYTPPAFMAVAYLGMRDHDRVFDSLEQAMDEGSALPCVWATFPWSDPVRSDPRFHALLRRMNFPQQAQR